MTKTPFLPDHYILDEQGRPVALPDVDEWAKWFKAADRRLAETYVGSVLISTVFLGLDHNSGSHGPPILWETMVFGGEHDGYGERYATAKEAQEGHARATALVRGGEGTETLVCKHCGQAVRVLYAERKVGNFQLDNHLAPCGEVCIGGPLVSRGHSKDACPRCNSPVHGQ